MTKAVAWPPKGPTSGRKGDGMGEIISSAAKKYVRSVESNNTEQHGQYTLSRGKQNSFVRLNKAIRPIIIKITYLLIYLTRFPKIILLSFC